MNQITINGKQVQGKNISLVGNVLKVDGVIVNKDLTGDVHIIFEGDLANLDCTTATIDGNVQGDVLDGTTIYLHGH